MLIGAQDTASQKARLGGRKIPMAMSSQCVASRLVKKCRTCSAGQPWGHGHRASGQFFPWHSHPAAPHLALHPSEASQACVWTWRDTAGEALLQMAEHGMCPGSITGCDEVTGCCCEREATRGENAQDPWPPLLSSLPPGPHSFVQASRKAPCPLWRPWLAPAHPPPTPHAETHGEAA